MSGETDLGTLLASLTVTCDDEIYVFVTLPHGQSYETGAVKMQFEEAEGTTLIMTREAAEAAGLAYTFPSYCLTLAVHSSLEAIGFLAVITRELAAAQISVNPVAGYYHDHLFVPVAKRGDAEEVLRHMQQKAAKNS